MQVETTDRKAGRVLSGQKSGEGGKYLLLEDYDELDPNSTVYDATFHRIVTNVTQELMGYTFEGLNINVYSAMMATFLRFGQEYAQTLGNNDTVLRRVLQTFARFGVDTG